MHLNPIELDGSVDLSGAETHPMLADVVAATVALYTRKGFVRPWTGYVAMEAGQVVGTCGFAGPADGSEAEIAYFAFPDHEGNGVATRMATALMALAKEAAHSRGIRFVAHTLPADGPSTSILKKLGFVLLGSIQHPEDGEVWKWEQQTRKGAFST